MFAPATDHRFSSPSSPGGSEPMALGSPISSPSRNGQPNINFLPSYLLRGDVPGHVSPTSSPSLGDWRSPIGKQIPDSFIVSQMSPAVARKNLFQPNTTNSMSQVLNTANVAKPGGPPVQGLFDSVSSPRPNTLELSKVDESVSTSALSQTFRPKDSPPFNGVLTPNKSFSHNMSTTYMSPAQIDPFYTQGEAITPESKLDETWITIFGFPPAATNYILQQFSNYGKILDQKLATKGNWIHIRYQSKLQAKKALSKNGKVFGDNIMVGVKPCIEMDLMNDSGKENTEAELSTSNFCQDSFDMESLNSSTRSLKNMRRLTQMHRTPSSNTEVTPKAKVEPKAHSLVSKAMEYVFKW